MTAIIDKGKRVKHIGSIEAYMVNHKRGTVDLYRSPTDKTTVDICKHKLTLREGHTAVAVFSNGKVIA
jgi:hypothetical protein